MTQKEFWERLAKGKGEFKIKLSPIEGTHIRHAKTDQCPIEFAANINSGEWHFDRPNWKPFRRIVFAADGCTHGPIRRRLLKILGLKELP